MYDLDKDEQYFLLRLRKNIVVSFLWLKNTNAFLMGGTEGSRTLPLQLPFLISGTEGSISVGWECGLPPQPTLGPPAAPGEVRAGGQGRVVPLKEPIDLTHREANTAIGAARKSLWGRMGFLKVAVRPLPAACLPSLARSEGRQCRGWGQGEGRQWRRSGQGEGRHCRGSGQLSGRRVRSKAWPSYQGTFCRAQGSNGRA